MMTKDQFLKEVNFGRYPKYVISQIKEGKPEQDCSSIVCTFNGNILLAKYEGGRWQQAHFTSTDGYYYHPPQRLYYDDIREGIIYWIDGEPTDCSRGQYK